MTIYYTYLFISIISLSLLFSRFYGFKKISKDIEISINPFKNFHPPAVGEDFLVGPTTLPDLDPENDLDRMKAKIRLLPTKILVYAQTVAAILFASALIIAPFLTILTEKILHSFLNFSF